MTKTIVITTSPRTQPIVDARSSGGAVRVTFTSTDPRAGLSDSGTHRGGGPHGIGPPIFPEIPR